jgi:hypothetical protein
MEAADRRIERALGGAGTANRRRGGDVRGGRRPVVWPAELLPKVPAGHWSGNEGLLDELTKPDTIGFACHFGDQPFGRGVTSAAGRVWEPVHTTRRAPAPRTFI